MPRFPAYEENILSLGKLIAEAASNPEMLKKLQDNPAAELRRIGLPEQTVSLFEFKIFKTQSGEKEPVVLPWRLNAAKLANKDINYLNQIADMLPQTAARN